MAVDDVVPFPGTTSAITVNVLANDSGPAGATLQVTAVGAASRGDVGLTPDGMAVTYRLRPQNAGGQGGDSFTYTMTATTASGSQSAMARVILQQPTLSFTYDCNSWGCAFVPQASHAVDYYEWHWGDGSNQDLNPWFGPTAFHIFPAFNTPYNVQLVAHHGTTVTSVTRTVTVTNTPAIVWQPDAIGLALSVVVVSSNVSTWNAAVTTWVDWGDGTATSPFGQGAVGVLHGRVADHVYRWPGTYTPAVKVTVNAPTGPETHTFPHQVQLQNNPPQNVGFTYQSRPMTGAPYNYLFSVSAETWDEHHASTLRYIWDLDGHIVETSEPAVNYTLFGPRLVRLTVVDLQGATASAEQTIDFPNQIPQIGETIWTHCVGLTCRFEAASVSDLDGPPPRVHWDLGDGTFGHSEPEPAAGGNPFAFRSVITHTFATYGTRLVDATPDDGIVLGTPQRVRVTPNPLLSGGLRYFAIPPCEMYDSEKTALVSGGPVTIDGFKSPCGIPRSARAMAVTMTVMAATGAGYLQVNDQPDGFPMTSVVNFAAATMPRSNAVIAPASDGVMYVQSSVAPSAGNTVGTYSLHVDVTGYFAADEEPAGQAVGPLRFAMMAAPRRLYDSRNAGGSALVPNNPTLLTLTDPNTGGVFKAAAVVGNLTAVLPGGTGSIALYPSTLTRAPQTSSIAVRSGVVAQASNFVTMVGPPATIGVNYEPEDANATSHFVIDGMAYFSGEAPLEYYAVRPCRLIDTRDPYRPPGPGDFPGQRMFFVRDCGYPEGAQGMFGVLTVVGPAGNGYGRVDFDPSQLNETSAINYTTESPISNGVFLKSAVFWMSTDAEIIFDLHGYFAPPNFVPQPITNAAGQQAGPGEGNESTTATEGVSQ